MKQKKTTLRGVLRRLEAALLAAGTLWIAAVTAGSDTAAAAFSALAEALPERMLRWELGDLWTRDSLSPAAALAIGESPCCCRPGRTWRRSRPWSAGSRRRRTGRPRPR